MSRALDGRQHLPGRGTIVTDVTEWYDRGLQPRFEHPPVIEAALGLEFAPVPGLGAYQLGRLQGVWETDYPVIQDVPGTPSSELVQPVGMSVQFNLGQPPTRMWAQSTANGRLIQTQADRLVLNWRNETGGRRYPGYEDLRQEYVRLWGLFTDYLREAQLPQPSLIYGEYIYVNSVVLEPGELMSDVVTVVQTPQDPLPGQELLTRFQFVRDVKQGEEHPMTAQIVVNGEPQIHGNERRVQLSVDTRTIFDGTQPDPFLAIDAAHSLSSHTFARIISPNKRKTWVQQSGTGPA